MMIHVWLNNGEEIECKEVNDSRKFWRMISKTCKRHDCRVIKVSKTEE